jgi:serine/threonine-protein kinase
MKKFGRYDVVEELGRGAMGVVYKAADPTLGRLVALKVLSLPSSSEPGVPGPRDIFMREARAAGRLAHPAIVTIHDAFEDPDTKSSCIVMELVPGRTLEKMLLSGWQFSVEQALEIVRQVADGLDCAHRHQVIHRDLKPANILLSEDGRAKLTDFGIAKIMAREGALRTATLMGTPSYMSPEQVTGKDIDARSDLFSLGIILYLLLTGQKPFTGDTTAVMFKIVYEDPVPPSKLKPQLSPAHDYLALRLLAKDRNKRYASARQFLDDLDDVRSGRPPRSEVNVPASALPVGERTLVARAPLVSPPKEGLLPAKRKTNWVAAGVGAALIILGAGLGVGLWKSRHPKAPAAPVARASAQAAGAAQTSPAPPTTSAPQPLSPAPAVTPSSLPALRQAHGSTLLPGLERNSRGEQIGTAQAGQESPSIPATGQPASNASKIQLRCKHELKEGKLSVSTGAQVILRADLKGKKKGGFHRVTGGYEGFLSRALTVPPGTRDLTVRVSSPAAGIDLSNTLPFTPPAASPALLEVIVKRDAIQLNWRAPAPSKP